MDHSFLCCAARRLCTARRGSLGLLRSGILGVWIECLRGSFHNLRIVALEHLSPVVLLVPLWHCPDMLQSLRNLLILRSLRQTPLLGPSCMPGNEH